MDFFDYIDIFWRRRNIFFSVIAVSVLCGAIFYSAQKESYVATLLLNISRSGSQSTSEYTYDGFYRLQADERFADTVVRWLSAPRIAEDILRQSGIETESLGTKELSRVFRAGRLSSQVIRVEYSGRDSDTLEKYAISMLSVLNASTEDLNQQAKDPSWFHIEGSAPVIRSAKIQAKTVFFLSLAIGVFFGFWIALFAHFFEQKQRERDGWLG